VSHHGGHRRLALGDAGTPQAFRGTSTGPRELLAPRVRLPLRRGCSGRCHPCGSNPWVWEESTGVGLWGSSRRDAQLFCTIWGAGNTAATPSFEKGKSPLEMAFRVTPLQQAMGTPTANQGTTGTGAALQTQVVAGAFEGVTFGGRWARGSDGDGDDEEEEGDGDTPDRRPAAPAARARDVQVRPGLVTGMVS